MFSGNLRRELLALVGAVALLLLIACANLANLLLARLSSRSRELATRIALGASRSRLVRQLLTESMVIAALGGATGLLVALWGTRALAWLGPSSVPALKDSHLNAPVLAFTMMTALVTAVIFGLVPALVSGRSDPQKNLRGGARGSSSGAQGGRLRRGLVATEVALCSSLMIVALLLLHSFINVLSVDKGFVAERVLSVDLALPARSYASTRVPSFYHELVGRAQTLPGVSAAGAVTLLPLLGESITRGIRLESDIDYTHDLERPVAVLRGVTAGYFDTMGIQLVAGRFFVEQEPYPTAIISTRLARGLWPDRSSASSIGRRIRQGDLDTPLLTIVGVVGDVRSGALDREPMPAIYRPHTQTTSPNMTLVMRTSGDPLALVSASRAEVKRLDAKLPVPTARTLEEIIAQSVATRRFQLALTVLFALVSLALGAVGVYGVTSYGVARQTREIGVRMALGAQRFEVLRDVLVQGLRPVLLGLGVGIVGAIAGARSVRSFLFGVGPLDPWALSSGCGILLVAAIVACYLPAKRASLVDPVTALRSE